MRPIEAAYTARMAMRRVLAALGAMGAGGIAYNHYVSGLPLTAWAGWAALGLAMLAAAVTPAAAFRYRAGFSAEALAPAAQQPASDGTSQGNTP